MILIRTDHEIRWHAGTSTGFYTIHITLAVHSSSISDERTFTVLCTVNTVPHTLRLLTVELICSQVLLTYICVELRVDCLGEETSFIRRLRICYSITQVYYKHCNATWPNLFVYCFTVTDSIFRCVLTVYYVVCFCIFSLWVQFIYCKITLQ